MFSSIYFHSKNFEIFHAHLPFVSRTRAETDIMPNKIFVGIPFMNRNSYPIYTICSLLLTNKPKKKLKSKIFLMYILRTTTM